MAVSVGLFAYGGYWLDQRWGLVPLFTLLGVLLGFCGGLIHLLRVVAPELLPFTPKSRPDAGDADADPPPDRRDDGP